MSIEIVDTIKSLERAGFKREQAEEQVRAMTKFTKDHAMKADISNVEKELVNTRSELKENIARVEKNLADTRSELKSEIKDLRNEVKDLRIEIKNDLNDFATKEEMNLRFDQAYAKMDTLLTTKSALTICTLFATFLAVALTMLELRTEIMALFR